MDRHPCAYAQDLMLCWRAQTYEQSYFWVGILVVAYRWEVIHMSPNCIGTVGVKYLQYTVALLGRRTVRKKKFERV